MAEHLTEEQQVEAIKQWWKDNGMSVAIGLVIGFAALFGWNYWNDYRDQQGAMASRVYQQLLTDLQANNTASVQKLGDQLRNDYSRTPYAVLAAMSQARLAVENKDLELAAAHLQWAIANTRQDQLKQTAQLRLARVLIAAGKYDEASNLLATNKSAAYAAAYAELQGDLAVAKGDRDAARTAYQQAITAAADDQQLSAAIRLKLDDVAAMPTPAPAAVTEEK